MAYWGIFVLALMQDLSVEAASYSLDVTLKTAASKFFAQRYVSTSNVDRNDSERSLSVCRFVTFPA